MKKLLIAVVVVVGLGFLLRRVGARFANTDWEKRFESMPDNAPPKWMFRNISEIHENTDRILELLEGRGEEATTRPEELERNAT